MTRKPRRPARRLLDVLPPEYDVRRAGLLRRLRWRLAASFLLAVGAAVLVATGLAPLVESGRLPAGTDLAAAVIVLTGVLIWVRRRAWSRYVDDAWALLEEESQRRGDSSPTRPG